MLELLDGRVEALIDTSMHLRVGPICFSLLVPRAYAIKVGSEITLNTLLLWNQETGPQLFGFITPLDRTVFTLVTECSGIGPKLALALIEQLGPETIVTALYEGNEKVLSSVSGIGAKKAEYMIVHLKHKAQKLITSGFITSSGSLSHFHDLDAALQSLHYSRGEIQRALEHLKQVPRTETSPLAFDVMLRRALSYLTHKQ